MKGKSFTHARVNLVLYVAAPASFLDLIEGASISRSVSEPESDSVPLAADSLERLITDIHVLLSSFGSRYLARCT